MFRFNLFCTNENNKKSSPGASNRTRLSIRHYLLVMVTIMMVMITIITRRVDDDKIDDGDGNDDDDNYDDAPECMMIMHT